MEANISNTFVNQNQILDNLARELSKTQHQASILEQLQKQTDAMSTDSNNFSSANRRHVNGHLGNANISNVPIGHNYNATGITPMSK